MVEWGMVEWGMVEWNSGICSLGERSLSIKVTPVEYITC